MTQRKNIVNDLYSKLPNFSATDRKIASFILSDPSKVVNMTIAELAQAAKVSEASVSRFCRTIELDGFHQLKIELAKVADDENSYYHKINGNSIDQALASISRNKIAEVDTTLQATPADDIERALNYLTETPVIQCIGAGGTYPVAMDAAYKFNQLGLLALTDPSWESSVAQTLNLPKGAVLMVISNSGETLHLITQVKLAKKQGVHVIALTNRANSPIGQLADVHILTAVRQQVFDSEYYFSRLSATTAIEALFLLLLTRNTAFATHIKQHEEIIANTKI
ncbi:MurR/RpiR family transcriptional regulator [Lacticaseibacillus zhaodongensis]|uniref:MurR/RpiR family transcriptional regulator n=1 Tax=Lacticaseibacillus zhaodongensis TaxID=2668065 RepID=UPI0012D33461|nr:MurR/RpiR family transcriptional regulator [Lacticaseibacillus zhaodongensis]